MATGIEAAGLVLGLFPIVLEGIQFYISSAEKFKEMKHHKRTLVKFRRELEMEESIFDNIWSRLVSRAGAHTRSNMEEVLFCLPPNAARSFAHGCQELNTILSELTQKFEKYEQDKVGLDYTLARLCF